MAAVRALTPGPRVDRYAVIGHPISHSLSPRIHAAFAEALGETLAYEPIDVPPAALATMLQRLYDEGYAGVNVTLPHKVEAAARCLAVSERAQQSGAVNTLIRAEGGWNGDETDGEGLMRDLQRLGVTVAGRRVLVLGAGGAARAALRALAAAGPARLVVSNRNPWKPEALAEALAPVGRITPRTHLALKGDAYDLVLHATSAGHQGRFPRLPPGLIAAGGDAYDLSYGAAHAPFAEWARSESAARVFDGLGMLVEQAAAAYALWRGRRPDAAPVIAALRAES